MSCLAVLALVAGGEPVYVERLSEGHLFDSLTPFAPGEVKLGGEIGRRLDSALEKMLHHTDVENTFAKHFKCRKAEPEMKGGFAGYGMFLDALVKAAAHGIGGSAAVEAKTRLLAEIVSAQAPDGSISMYEGKVGFWDSHEQAYLMQALVRDWLYFHSAASLDAARRLGDFLCTTNARATLGTDSAFVLLAAATKDEKYFRYLREAVKIEAGLNDYDGIVIANGVMHVYTYLARALGQLEYADAFSARGELRTRLLDATEKAFCRARSPYLSISGTITGVADWGELWDASQAGVGNWGETCATAYLMRLAAKRIQSDASTYYGDLFERLLYNAFFAAQSDDGLRYCYFSPFNQPVQWYDRDTYCCPNNFRREIFEVPDMAFFKAKDGLVVNLYSDAVLSADGYQVEMSTAYPADSRVTLDVTMPMRRLYLRIPVWCTNATVRIDGGARLTATRGWCRVDADFSRPRKVELKMEMPVRVVKGVRAQEGRVAICRGPCVYGMMDGSSVWAVDIDEPIEWNEAAGAPEVTMYRLRGHSPIRVKLVRYCDSRRIRTFLDAAPHDFKWQY